MIRCLIVSIPFKRESISKDWWVYRIDWRVESFNSLQTGKYIQSSSKREIDLTDDKFQFPSNGKVYPKFVNCLNAIPKLSFNSLQTGKYIQRAETANTRADEAEFQFPSNGKVYPKTECFCQVYILNLVSIPFKRESISKEGGLGHLRNNRHHKFQFPSNGKVYPKLPTTSSKTAPIKCFNSLQTGKYIQSSQRDPCTRPVTRKFQFPSNGKVYPKGNGSPDKVQRSRFNSLQTGKYIQRGITVVVIDWGLLRVSIPFKRESISKELDLIFKLAGEPFQFPSNGKVYPKWDWVSKVTLKIVSIPFKRESISKEMVSTT